MATGGRQAADWRPPDKKGGFMPDINGGIVGLRKLIFCAFVFAVAAALWAVGQVKMWEGSDAMSSLMLYAFIGGLTGKVMDYLRKPNGG
jgi:hypothetical protein